MSKHVFGRGKELQTEVMQLFNLYSNKLDDLVDSLDKEDVIQQLVRNTIAQFAEPEIGVANNFELEEKMIEDLVGDRFDVHIFPQRNQKI